MLIVLRLLLMDTAVSLGGFGCDEVTSSGYYEKEQM